MIECYCEECDIYFIANYENVCPICGQEAKIVKFLNGEKEG